MKNYISRIDKYIKKNYIFYTSGFDILGNDLYFCKCGNKIIAHPNETSFALKVKHDGYNLSDITNFGIDSFGAAFRKANIVCSKCHRNYSEPSVYSTIQNVDVMFYEKFDITESKTSITLHRIRAAGEYLPESQTYNPKIIESTLTISKKSKRIKYQPFPTNNSDVKQDVLVHLENVIKVSKEFFGRGNEIVFSDGFINIHDFIGRVAKLIVDAKNMNIIDELMSLMVGKTGITILQRTMAIFLGILCYPNLATIALTKGNIFLYDLMESCPLPAPSFLRKNKATSPIKIFNTLVSIKNKQLQDQLDEDDTMKLGYVFKTASGIKINIKYDQSDIDKLDNATLNLGKESDNGARIFVRDEIKNKKISPYIFNKLTNFTDYTHIIKWLRFISYDDLIQLTMKYDLELLYIIFKKIEFRDDITYNRLQQFIPLLMDYAKQKTLNKIKSETGAEITEETIVDYNSILNFDFSLYDDCVRMVHELNWKSNKVLDKIKKFDKLGKFHDDLLKYRSYISDAEANKKYIENSIKYSYLEGDKESIEKLYRFSLSLIKTPKELLDHAVEMRNCAGSYVNKVANGEYIPFILKDNSRHLQAKEFHRYMMILKVTELGLELVGVKSICNQYGSDRFKKEFRQFLIDSDISFQEVPSIRYGVVSTEKSYEGTFEKVIYGNVNKEEFDKFTNKD